MDFPQLVRGGSSQFYLMIKPKVTSADIYISKGKANPGVGDIFQIEGFM